MNKVTEAIKTVIEIAEADNNQYFELIKATAVMFPAQLIEPLQQLLFRGPVHDGDVISKAFRDELINIGIATRVCFKGQQGYTAARYVAYTIHNCLIELGRVKEVK